MNPDHIDTLEKQVINNLPESFWEITDQSEKLVKLSDKILYSGAIFACVFQLICLIALVVLPAHKEERNFSPDSHHIDESKFSKKNK